MKDDKESILVKLSRVKESLKTLTDINELADITNSPDITNDERIKALVAIIGLQDKCIHELIDVLKAYEAAEDDEDSEDVSPFNTPGGLLGKLKLN